MSHHLLRGDAVFPGTQIDACGNHTDMRIQCGWGQHSLSTRPENADEPVLKICGDLEVEGCIKWTELCPPLSEEPKIGEITCTDYVGGQPVVNVVVPDQSTVPQAIEAVVRFFCDEWVPPETRIPLIQCGFPEETVVPPNSTHEDALMAIVQYFCNKVESLAPNTLSKVTYCDENYVFGQEILVPDGATIQEGFQSMANYLLNRDPFLNNIRPVMATEDSDIILTGPSDPDYYTLFSPNWLGSRQSGNEELCEQDRRMSYDFGNKTFNINRVGTYKLTLRLAVKNAAQTGSQEETTVTMVAHWPNIKTELADPDPTAQLGQVMTRASGANKVTVEEATFIFPVWAEGVGSPVGQPQTGGATNPFKFQVGYAVQDVPSGETITIVTNSGDIYPGSSQFSQTIASYHLTCVTLECLWRYPFDNALVLN